MQVKPQEVERACWREERDCRISMSMPIRDEVENWGNGGRGTIKSYFFARENGTGCMTGVDES